MDYVIGRLVLIILKALSSLALVIGIFIAFGGMTGGLIMFARQELGIPVAGSFFSVFAGFIMAFTAMIALAVLDHILATIDTAIWSKISFLIAEQQLAVSKDALRVGKLVQAVQAPNNC